MSILEEKFPGKFSKCYLWSDGCTAQYKGKNTFFHLSKPDSLFTCERHYYGSEHGKGDSDLETALINKKLNVAIRSRQVIVTDAADMFNFLSSYPVNTKNNTERIYRLVSPMIFQSLIIMFLLCLVLCLGHYMRLEVLVNLVIWSVSHILAFVVIVSMASSARVKIKIIQMVILFVNM